MQSHDFIGLLGAMQAWGARRLGVSVGEASIWGVSISLKMMALLSERREQIGYAQVLLAAVTG